MAPMLPAINSGQRLRIFIFFVLIVVAAGGFHALQVVVARIAGDDPVVRGFIEGRRLHLRWREAPVLEGATVHALDVQLVLLVEVKIECMQPVYDQHVAFVKGIEQGVSYGSHGDQSVIGKVVMITQCGLGPWTIRFENGVTCKTAIASKLAPTVGFSANTNSVLTKAPLWERACSR
ncbi:hypothetical protein EMIT0P228_20179 [Pseudomonas brassicacearum]